MGQLQLCRRRAAATEEAGEADWLIIPAPVALPRVRWLRAFSQVTRLLKLRKLWSRLGVWLQHNRHHALSQTLRVVWSQLGNYLNARRSIAAHLTRNRGRLVYRVQTP